MGRKPRERTVEPGNRLELQRELLRAKRRFGLSSQARVVSCCEAGRDGFWVHRFLQSQGLSNLVVDSSSIQVTRRARRVKADGPDVRQLCVMLLRWHSGEKKVWSVVRVPSEQQEDARHPH
ncbi:MAG: IS110 family transposase, partial [Acidobacteriota bacterium]